MRTTILLIILASLCLFTGCEDFPRDVEGSLSDAKSHGLRVGYSQDPKGFIHRDEDVYHGEGARLVEAFAREIGAKVIWVEEPSEELFKKLEKFEIHLLLERLSKDSPWKKEVAFTRSYTLPSKETFSLAVPPGENGLLLSLEHFLASRYERSSE